MRPRKGLDNHQQAKESHYNNIEIDRAHIQKGPYSATYKIPFYILYIVTPINIDQQSDEFSNISRETNFEVL